MTDHARADVRDEVLHDRTYLGVVRPQAVEIRSTGVQNPVGITPGAVVDVLLDPPQAGGYIACEYAGTTPTMLLFRLNDGRHKGHTPEEIALVRKVTA